MSNILITLLVMTLESKKRHLFKAITWRIISSITSFLLAYLVIGDVGASLKIGAADVVIKFILYYFHERAWYKRGLAAIKKKNSKKDVKRFGD